MCISGSNRSEQFQFREQSVYKIADSKYRYNFEDFRKIFDSIVSIKNHHVLLCGDRNFPQTDWRINQSTGIYENEILELVDEAEMNQIIEFPTCGSNILDVALMRGLEGVGGFESCTNSEKSYDITDHRPISLKNEIDVQDEKPVKENFYSFYPFSPICFTNIDRMSDEMYEYINNLISNFVPKRTMHRQKLPPWVSPKTSNLIKILETKRKQFDSRPTPHLQETITNFENSLMQNMELERVETKKKVS